MAWNPKGGGGPWGGGGGGGGGPWGGGGGGGGGPWTGGGGPAGPPPNVEEMIRRGQDRLKRMMPGGMGPVRGLVLAAIAVLVVWLGYTVPYRVLPGEQGIELLFGKFVKTTSPGLNFWFPPPIGSYVKLDVEGTRTTDIGFQRRIAGRGRETEADVPLESLMLTGDQNIIDIDFVVQWRISNAADYLFNIERPDITIKRAAESAMREVVGQTPLEEALATKRPQVQAETRILLQQILDDYGAGVAIAEVQLQKVDPPQDVIDAFNDVQRARQDQERSIN